MAANNKVQIELEVQDNGTVVVKNFGSEADKALGSVADASDSATGRIQAGWQKLKSAWAEVVAGILAVREAWDMLQTAAQARQERQAFENMAASYGESGDKILEKLKDVSRGTVDTMTLIQKAGTAMMTGLAPDDIISLMEIAQATSKQTGQTVSEAFSDISLGVARQSKMILDNLGIMIDVEAANKAYAKSLGKTSEELTDAEKKQAFINATLKSGQEIIQKLGSQAETESDRFQRFNATLQNLRIEVGDYLIRAFQFLEGTFKSVAAAALTLSGGVFKIIEGVAWLTDKLHLSNDAAADWKVNAEAAFGAAEDLAFQADQAFKDAFDTTTKAGTAQKDYTKNVKDTTAALEAQQKAQEKLKKQIEEAAAAVKSDADARREANKTMYEGAGIDAKAYYANEAAALIAQADKWENAGIEISKINEYLYEKLGKLAEEAYGKGEDEAGDYLETLRAKSDVLITEFEKTQTEAVQYLDNIGLKVKELDGQEIALSLTLQEDVSGIIDKIVEKLEALQAAAAAAAANVSSATTSSGSAGATPSTESGGGSATIYEGASSVTLNVSEKLSRSDVVNIVAETKRISYRG